VPQRDTIDRPELLLPAGGFSSAIAAIDGGADALYLGLSEFSARNQARNFDRLEYRRLLGHARRRGIKLYVAVNTVIKESELESAIELLTFLGSFPPDAVITQDWGLARLIAERFRGLRIHASTQTAIQSPSAALLARDLGCSRVVLPRETSLSTLRRFATEAPDIEYEVFVHGALCYSYSGLCLASGVTLGRSGNRGDCAQVCRSYYCVGEGSSRERGYWFSCRDLCLVERVAELTSAGARSFKVEGRMKSPEYCYSVARLYRTAIDGIGSSHSPDLGPLLEDARLSFARDFCEGWIEEKGGTRLIDAEYPAHRGLEAGHVISSNKGRLVVELKSELGLRDGVLIFEGGDPSRPLQFSVQDLRDAKSGAPRLKASRGERVEFGCVQGSPRPGDKVMRISARDRDRKEPSPEEYPPELQSLRLSLVVDEGRFGAELHLPSFDGLDHGLRERNDFHAERASIGFGQSVPMQRARSSGGFKKALELFSEGGEADFRLEPLCEGRIKLRIEADPERVEEIEFADLFVPPSIVKREKNRIYEEAASCISSAREAKIAECLAASVKKPTRPWKADSHPPRSALTFRHPSLPQGMPFATARILREGAELPSWGGALWLPLAPVVADIEEYEAMARTRVRAQLNEGCRLYLGIDALHHLSFARSLLESLPRQEKELLGFFLDMHLYAANRFSLSAFAAMLPELAFAYSYIELKEEEAILESKLISERCDPDELPCLSVGRGRERIAPLFYSLGCLKKHHVDHGLCPPLCSRRMERILSDRDRRYIALTEDCVTMLFLL
jgi:collagenase-like PrtC family protease